VESEGSAPNDNNSSEGSSDQQAQNGSPTPAGAGQAPSSNSTDSSKFPQSLLLEKKSSAHSIFEAVEEDPTPSKPIEQKLSPPPKTGHLVKVNSTAVGFNSTGVKDERMSIFEASLDDPVNSNETLVLLNTSHHHNKSNLEAKVELFNNPQLIPKILKTSKTMQNLTEISRLAARNKKNHSIMIELQAGKKKKNNTIDSVRSIRVSNFKKPFANKTLEIDKDKQERISKFYKAYQERRKLLIEKLKEKNKPPLFKGNEIQK
jgi:hypothetical protein